MRRDLVVLRCGRRSARPAWAVAEDRAFDVLPCPYEEVEPFGDRPDLVRTIPGQKWTGLARFLAEVPAWRDYEHVWLPDDDLEGTAADVDRFFAHVRGRDAALAAPALTQDSHHSHLVTLENRAFEARRTTFVEVMAPCFRRDVLERLLPTLSATTTGFGWGLDDAWGRLLEYRGLWVIDAVTVAHRRPVGSARSLADRDAARAEMRRTRARFRAGSLRKTLGGDLREGGSIDEADPRFLAVYLDGYRDLLGRIRGAEGRIRRAQALSAADFLAAGAGAAAVRESRALRRLLPWWFRDAGP